MVATGAADEPGSRRTLKSRPKAAAVQFTNCLSIALSCQLSLFITHTHIHVSEIMLLSTAYSVRFNRENLSLCT